MSDEKPKFQRRKDDRPGELIKAGKAEFVEHGFGGAKLARIAKRAGVSNGTLYHYFSDKSELFRAVFRAAFVAPITGQDAQGMSSTDNVLMSAIEQLLEEDSLALVAILLFEAKRHPDPVGEIASEVLSTAEQMLGVFLAQHLREGVVAPIYPLGLILDGITVALLEKARGNVDWKSVALAASREQLRRQGFL